MASSKTTSGIIETASGERHIPSSVRADGSTRREIRIRPGYRPPEDIEVYKNRTAEAWKTRGTGGIPGAEGLKSEQESKPASSKNAKRREARKRAKVAATQNNESENEQISKCDQPLDPISEIAASGADGGEEAVIEDAEGRNLVEREKQVRKLKKKLREAKELQEKKDKGEKLLQEQFEKVIRISELNRALEKLGVHSETHEDR